MTQNHQNETKRADCGDAQPPIDWPWLRQAVETYAVDGGPVDVGRANAFLAWSDLALSHRGERMVVEDFEGAAVRVYDYTTGEELSQ